MNSCPVFLLPALLVLVAASAGAEPEIYRCTQEDGTIAFRGTPCDAPAGESADNRNETGSDGASRGEVDEAESAEGASDFVNPFDEPHDPPAPGEPELPAGLSEDRAACIKSRRDAIDAIDLEMRKGYTREEGRQYLAELLELTQQLRACKQL